MDHPVVGPLITNPQIGTPVVYSLYRQMEGGKTPEALQLTSDWYFERGEAPRVIGPESEITQFLMTDKGVGEARRAFAGNGGKNLVGDDRYQYHFDTEYFTETPNMLKDDWSGSFLGGYYVEIERAEGNTCKITVVNDTGWASGTRLPFLEKIVGHPVSLRPNVDRAEPGPGGTLWQYYMWYEEISVP